MGRFSAYWMDLALSSRLVMHNYLAAIPAKRQAFVFRSLVWLRGLRVCLDEKDSND